MRWKYFKAKTTARYFYEGITMLKNHTYNDNDDNWDNHDNRNNGDDCNIIGNIVVFLNCPSSLLVPILLIL